MEMTVTDCEPSVPAALPVAISNVKARGETILLVEDDNSIRRFLEVVLKRAGYQVISAVDGLEGMKAALATGVDAVVTDAVMPHLSGYELCRFLRRHPRLSHLPVVLLSALSHDEPSQAEDERPDLFMSKPVRPDELTSNLSRLLNAVY